METQKKLGTAWTGDGEGECAANIWRKIGFRHFADHAEKFSMLADCLDGEWQRPTNLALTGAPLTPEDIERILSPEFRVGGGK